MEVSAGSNDPDADDDLDDIHPVTDDQRRIENLLRNKRTNKTKRNKIEQEIQVNWCEIQR